MAIGEQVFVIRNYRGIPFQHHGIDCGNGFIIHYAGDFDQDKPHQIIRESYDNFAKGSSVITVEDQSGDRFLFSEQVVIKRAESRLGERQYHLFKNNCEHFATWCKTGHSLCRQANLYRMTSSLLISGLALENNWIKRGFNARTKVAQGWRTQDSISSIISKN